MMATPSDPSLATALGVMRTALRMAMLTGLSLAPLPASSAPNAADRPNFILINIDDLGYADIGPFGSKLNRTPKLERMAQEGRKLTSFYAVPVCSPSRAALMTGCYPKRALPIPHVLFPADAVGLSPKEVTVAEVLKAEGYATSIIGKWHLGDQPEFLPTNQGFDEQLEALVAAMRDDLGLAGRAVGSRELGKVTNAQPIIGHDGKVRAGFEAK